MGFTDWSRGENPQKLSLGRWVTEKESPWQAKCFVEFNTEYYCFKTNMFYDELSAWRCKLFVTVRLSNCVCSGSFYDGDDPNVLISGLLSKAQVFE